MSRIGCSSSTSSTRGRSGLGRALARVPVSFLTELINLLNLSHAILWHPRICTESVCQFKPSADWALQNGLHSEPMRPPCPPRWSKRLPAPMKRRSRPEPRRGSQIPAEGAS